MYCKSCNYELSGLVEDRCPECSRVFSPEDPDSFAAASSAGMWIRMTAAAGALTVGLGLLIWLCFHLTSAIPLILVLPCGVLGMAMMLIAMYERRPSPSRTSLLSALLPSALLLAAYYSLAVHMYLSLGAWPKSIGTHRFSQSLTLHADVLEGTLLIVIFANWVGYPILAIWSLIQRRLHGLHAALGIYGISMTVAAGLMLLAPSEFQYWFAD